MAPVATTRVEYSGSVSDPISSEISAASQEKKTFKTLLLESIFDVQLRIRAQLLEQLFLKPGDVWETKQTPFVQTPGRRVEQTIPKDMYNTENKKQPSFCQGSKRERCLALKLNKMTVPNP